MSTSKSDLKKSDFELISDKKEYEGLLFEAGKTKAFTTLWTPNQEKTIQTFIEDVRIKDLALYVQIPKGVPTNELKEFLNKNSIHECFFNVKLSKTSLFFKAKYYQNSDLQYVFKIPEKLFRVQRRADLRFNFLKSDDMSVSYPNPKNAEQLLVKKILNVSAGGLGIEIGEFEMPQYPVGLKINDLTFKLKDKIITATAEVRHVQKLKAKDKSENFEPKAVLGIQFIVLNTILRQYIGAFVFDETRRLYARYIDF